MAKKKKSKKAVRNRKSKTRTVKAAVSPAAANKRLARRWFEQVWNKKRAQAIDEMMSASCIGHGKAADGGDSIGADGFKSFHEAYLGAFPDLHVDVEDVIAEGSKVAVRWTASGTHQGGSLGFAATGKPMRINGMTFVVMKGGKVVEGWDAYDQHGMLQQLGLGAAPPGSRAL
jgi:steroid delta-isomerase-like uncharacterized protein